MIAIPVPDEFMIYNEFIIELRDETLIALHEDRRVAAIETKTQTKVVVTRRTLNRKHYGDMYVRYIIIRIYSDDSLKIAQCYTMLINKVSELKNLKSYDKKATVKMVGNAFTPDNTKLYFGGQRLKRTSSYFGGLSLDSPFQTDAQRPIDATPWKTGSTELVGDYHSDLQNKDMMLRHYIGQEIDQSSVKFHCNTSQMMSDFSLVSKCYNKQCNVPPNQNTANTQKSLRFSPRGSATLPGASVEKSGAFSTFKKSMKCHSISHAYSGGDQFGSMMSNSATDVKHSRGKSLNNMALLFSKNSLNDSRFSKCVLQPNSYRVHSKLNPTAHCSTDVQSAITCTASESEYSKDTQIGIVDNFTKPFTDLKHDKLKSSILYSKQEVDDSKKENENVESLYLYRARSNKKSRKLSFVLDPSYDTCSLLQKTCLSETVNGTKDVHATSNDVLKPSNTTGKSKHSATHSRSTEIQINNNLNISAFDPIHKHMHTESDQYLKKEMGDNAALMENTINNGKIGSSRSHCERCKDNVKQLTCLSCGSSEFSRQRKCHSEKTCINKSKENLSNQIMEEPLKAKSYANIQKFVDGDQKTTNLPCDDQYRTSNSLPTGKSKDDTIDLRNTQESGMSKLNKLSTNSKEHAHRNQNYVLIGGEIKVNTRSDQTTEALCSNNPESTINANELSKLLGPFYDTRCLLETTSPCEGENKVNYTKSIMGESFLTKENEEILDYKQTIPNNSDISRRVTGTKSDTDITQKGTAALSNNEQKILKQAATLLAADEESSFCDQILSNTANHGDFYHNLNSSKYLRNTIKTAIRSSRVEASSTEFQHHKTKDFPAAKLQQDNIQEMFSKDLNSSKPLERFPVINGPQVHTNELPNESEVLSTDPSSSSEEDDTKNPSYQKTHDKSLSQNFESNSVSDPTTSDGHNEILEKLDMKVLKGILSQMLNEIRKEESVDSQEKYDQHETSMITNISSDNEQIQSYPKNIIRKQSIITDVENKMKMQSPEKLSSSHSEFEEVINNERICEKAEESSKNQSKDVNYFTFSKEKFRDIIEINKHLNSLKSVRENHLNDDKIVKSISSCNKKQYFGQVINSLKPILGVAVSSEDGSGSEIKLHSDVKLPQKKSISLNASPTIDSQIKNNLQRKIVKPDIEGIQVSKDSYPEIFSNILHSINRLYDSNRNPSPSRIGKTSEVEMNDEYDHSMSLFPSLSDEIKISLLNEFQTPDHCKNMNLIIDEDESLRNYFSFHVNEVNRTLTTGKCVNVNTTRS